MGFNSGRHDYPDLHKKQEAVPVQVPTFYSVGIKCLTNGNCVTVVASAGLHFRAFYLLTFAVSHDLKETIVQRCDVKR